MAQGHLLGWANDIRLTMAKDTGRGFFQQQVQTQGFLFLDDYLDSILSGPKKDPLIELVKTPGRRKIVAKKPKTASKLGTPIVFSLGHSVDENAPPSAISSNTHLSIDSEPKDSTAPTKRGDSQAPENRPILGETSAQANGFKPPMEEPEAPPEVDAAGTSNDDPTSFTLDQANLSIIAEDEEPSERTRLSIRQPNPAQPKAPSNKRSSPGASPGLPQELTLPEPTTNLARDSVEKRDFHDRPSAHGIPNSSTQRSHSEYPSTYAAPDSPTFPSNKRAKLSDEPKEKSKPIDETVVEAEQDADMDDAEVANHVTDPMDTDFTTKVFNDAPDSMDMTVPLRDADANNKTTSMAIPSLPDPVPLRKSMRAPRDPSVSGVLQGAATPGNPAGKRTSWLMKAREVKALDKTLVMKKSTVGALTPVPPVGPSNAGTKRKSDADAFPTPSSETEHKSKVAKHINGENPSSKPVDILTKPSPSSRHPSPTPQAETSTSVPQTSPGVLERLKQTMESLVGKTPAPQTKTRVFSAIAEARAAAEARIAERNHQDEAPALSNQTALEQKMEVDPGISARSQPLSVADLFPVEGKVKEKHKAPEKPFQFSALPAKKQETASSNRDSTSTTPPHSPPPASTSSSFVAPTGPVFKQPAPVFVPPAPIPTSRPLPSPPAKEFTFHPAPQSVFTSTFGINSPFSFGSQKEEKKDKAPLSAQSTLESAHSDRVFDDDDVPAWVPQTQDTEYTAGYDTQPATQDMNICDEDDSWPVDEKLAAGVQWTFAAGVKDDSMTWSTLPSQSQRGGDTTHFSNDKTTSSLRNAVSAEEPTHSQSSKIPGAFDFKMDHDGRDDLNKYTSKDRELEDAVLGSVRLVSYKNTPQKEPFRPQSQISIASSSSQESQSQGGFLNQASKLISSALGGGKKKQPEASETKQPEVKKPMTKPGAAAKKQQEEADKKANRLKEMEARRQQAMQKKAEEEKTRLVEERKAKEEMDRRKREREEQEKRTAVKPTPVKKGADAQPAKKPLAEKKSELKKTTSMSNLAKSQLKPALKTSTLHKTPTWGGSSQAGSSKSGETSKLPKFAPSSSSKGKAKAAPMAEDEVGHPSQFLQEQMAARAKAQIQAAKRTEPLVPSECIELPDINSEYSDSDDEDRKRTYDPPDWAQSPELKEALKMQSTINPDDIFGAVRPLRMDEIFKTRTSRFRARTSSANWTGTDRLTVAEEKEYAVRMGFK